MGAASTGTRLSVQYMGLGKEDMPAWAPDMTELGITLHVIAGEWFVEIVPWRYQTQVGKGVLVRLVPGSQDAKVPVAERIAPHAGELVELLSRSLAMKKDETTGLWSPELKPGQALIVDSKGSDEVTVIEPASVEKVEKKALTVEQVPCTCEIKLLMREGCKCGAAERNRRKA